MTFGVGGPFDFGVSLNPNLWIFRLQTLDMDFWLDKFFPSHIKSFYLSYFTAFRCKNIKKQNSIYILLNWNCVVVKKCEKTFRVISFCYVIIYIFIQLMMSSEVINGKPCLYARIHVFSTLLQFWNYHSLKNACQDFSQI